jgi:hypothetical protein
MTSFLFVGTITLFSVLTASAFAEIDKRPECADTRKTMTYSDKPVESYSAFMQDNRIKIVTPTFDLKNLQEFFFEYNKIPDVIRVEMLKAGAALNLINGQSVMDDPSWDPSQVLTFDGRKQDTVTGAGGSPSASKTYKNYIKSMANFCSYAGAAGTDERCQKDWTKEPVKVYPSRMVINRMYPDEHGVASHGSVNMVLHEYAHGMDNIYKERGVSKGANWDLLFKDATIRDYMKVACKASDYCLNNSNEAFAELFAFYHSCDETRDHMVKNAPKLSKYFGTLSLKKESQMVVNIFGGMTDSVRRVTPKKEMAIEPKTDLFKELGKLFKKNQDL